MKDDKVFLNHVLDEINKIKNTLDKATKSDFLDDVDIQDAIIRRIEIIGEASNNISDKTKEKVNLPWKDIIGMRNKLIHAYFGVDLESVWRTINDDLPILKKEIEKLLE